MNAKEIMDLALRLSNMNSIPADSTIHIDGNNIRRVLLTIDADPAIIMLAKEQGYDAVIVHHPIGISLLNFHKVFDRHIDYMLSYGIDEELATNAVNALKEKVTLRTHTSIYNHTVAVAEMLDMPLLNIHLPCDELMRLRIVEVLKGNDIEKISDIIKSVKKIPEFKNASTEPLVVYGDPDNIINRYAVVIAAGTNGGAEIAKLYFVADTNTVVYLHISNEELAKLKSSTVEGNLVILGHLAGDSLGLNIFADKLEEEGLEVTRLGIIY